jgi:2-amino-4-hydroxy-6-hydroxymethyldihydropteridine diphosphokinase
MISYLSLGSNLSNPILQLDNALESISSNPHINMIDVSSYYKTDPVGGVEQDDFINAVCKIDTSLTASGLLEVCHKIEQQQRRVRERRWGPRTIDIDILLYGDEIIKTKDLTIPHAEMSVRGFVLIPLSEIDKNIEIPERGALKDLVELAGVGGVVKIQKG